MLLMNVEFEFCVPVLQEEGKGVNEPPSLVYKDENTSYVSVSSSDDKMKPEQPKNDGGIVDLSERNGWCP